MTAPVVLVDTSAAVPFVVGAHEAHRETHAALGGRRLGLSGHAGFETYSVLTRLPPPLRRTPATVAAVLARAFPHPRFLSTDRATALAAALPGLGLAGGAVYDALVAATAAEHGLSLATRDRRAAAVYQALEVRVELLA